MNRDTPSVDNGPIRGQAATVALGAWLIVVGIERASDALNVLKGPSCTSGVLTLPTRLRLAVT